MNSLDIYKEIKYLTLYNEINVEINKVLIDTRKIKKNDCYVGIKGSKSEGC